MSFGSVDYSKDKSLGIILFGTNCVTMGLTI